jgi:hypothetical protein
MVVLGPKDLQTTKEGFMRIFVSFWELGITQSEAYHRTIAYCEYTGVSPSYTSFESFKSSALYEKKCKK